MKKYKYIIGIDPDCDKSGFCMIDTSDRTVNICSKTFPHLLDTLRTMQGIEGVIVIVEASWLVNTANYHKGYKDKKGKYHKHSESVNESISNQTGRNQETGRKIMEMAHYYGLEVYEIQPLKKCWVGTKGKITQDEIAYFIPDFPKRSNQDERDATLLAWNYAGYPIRVKPISAKAK